jgi:hypothetical protein
MPKTITVTYNFDSEEAFQAHCAKFAGRSVSAPAALPHAAPTGHVAPAPKAEPVAGPLAYTAPAAPAATVTVAAPPSASTAVQSTSAAPASVSSGEAPTPEEVREAFITYVKKGAGRTAATAKAIFAEFGASGLKDVALSNYAALLEAFQTR